MGDRNVAQWFAAFVPAPVTVSRREIALSALGALLGLGCAAWLGHHMLAGLDPWFIAPMGASAVLLFAVPSSPLAQPWSIVGGNVVAALIGVTCAAHVSDVALACALAGALAIAAMFWLRCLHPPSGAVALTAVLGGPAVKALGYAFVLWPVAIDSLLLLMAALAFNVSARRRYPHRAPAAAPAHGTRDAPPSERVGLTLQDLHAAIEARGELLDVSEDDLQELFVEAEHRAWRRRFGSLRCGQIMSHDVVSVLPSTSAQEAWRRMIHHAVKALPVVDAQSRLLGIVTLHDFFVGHRATSGGEVASGAAGHASWLVGDIMTRDVLTAAPEQDLVDLMHAFSDGGRHHLPVVDRDRRLVGMLTQSDMVAALFRAGIERPAVAA
ncbi:MAG TPA: HPP family protein [Burkholderiaceae bacterium]|nr:HPP family protein [Burkholderiaceae bacterium]